MSQMHESFAVPTYLNKEGRVEFTSHEYEGQIALIVGGSRGIGSSVVRRIAELGAKGIIINSREKSRSEAEALAAELSTDATSVCYVAGDIAKPGAGMDIIREASSRLGADFRLDQVIISAGIRDDGLFTHMSDEQIRRVMEVNFFGTAFIARDAIIQMRKQKPRGGSIVFISSLASEGNPGQANYSASKGAINSLTRTLAKEYAGSNIRINAVAPGLVDTDLTADLTKRQREMLLDESGSSRALTAKEVAEHIVFLASPKRAPEETGQIVPVVGL